MERQVVSTNPTDPVFHAEPILFLSKQSSKANQ